MRKVKVKITKTKKVALIETVGLSEVKPYRLREFLERALYLPFKDEWDGELYTILTERTTEELDKAVKEKIQELKERLAPDFQLEVVGQTKTTKEASDE